MSKQSTNFSYSDVSYKEDKDKFTCLSCKIVSTLFPNDISFTSKEMFVNHLEEHKKLNHSIPAHITKKLYNIKLKERER